MKSRYHKKCGHYAYLKELSVGPFHYLNYACDYCQQEFDIKYSILLTQEKHKKIYKNLPMVCPNEEVA